MQASTSWMGSVCCVLNTIKPHVQKGIDSWSAPHMQMQAVSGVSMRACRSTLLCGHTCLMRLTGQAQCVNGSVKWGTHPSTLGYPMGLRPRGSVSTWQNGMCGTCSHCEFGQRRLRYCAYVYLNRSIPSISTHGVKYIIYLMNTSERDISDKLDSLHRRMDKFYEWAAILQKEFRDMKQRQVFIESQCSIDLSADRVPDTLTERLDRIKEKK